MGRPLGGLVVLGGLVDVGAYALYKYGTVVFLNTLCHAVFN